MSNPARLGRLIAIAVGVAAFCMIPWTVFLGYTLPRRYDAKHWSLLWIGFDVILCAVLVTFAWLTWKRRQLMLVTAIIAGTLLFCDAWFDVITSWGNRDHWITVATALLAELPLAAFMFWLAYRAIRRSLAAYYALMGQADSQPGLLRAPALYTLPEAEPTTEALTPEDPCEPITRLAQARAGVRSVTSELHGALDSLSFVSNDSAVDRSGIEQARRAIEHALAKIESPSSGATEASSPAPVPAPPAPPPTSSAVDAFPDSFKI
jgi:hypothetical protein